MEKDFEKFITQFVSIVVPSAWDIQTLLRSNV